MKTSLYIITGVLFLTLFACSEADYMLYNNIDRVQITRKNMRYNFIYAKDREATRDTVYITVATIGYPCDYDRKIDFRQITEYTSENITDEKGNIIDVIYHEVLNKAVPGVHYIPMDSPEITPHLVIKANQVKAEVPVIVLKSDNLRAEAQRLCLELIETKDFALGENTILSQTVYIANNYSQPTSWDWWWTTYQLGKYSEAKHEFITITLGMDIDNDWFTLLNADPSYMYFCIDVCKNALKEFNADPANIASGKAPMVDEDNEEVKFP